jgi:hypothetical protein
MACHCADTALSLSHIHIRTAKNCSHTTNNITRVRTVSMAATVLVQRVRYRCRAYLQLFKHEKCATSASQPSKSREDISGRVCWHPLVKPDASSYHVDCA